MIGLDFSKAKAYLNKIVFILAVFTRQKLNKLTIRRLQHIARKNLQKNPSFMYSLLILSMKKNYNFFLLPRSSKPYTAVIFVLSDIETSKKCPILVFSSSSGWGDNLGSFRGQNWHDICLPLWGQKCQPSPENSMDR